MAKIGSQKCWFLLKIVRFSEKSVVLLFTKVGLYCADRENVRVCRFGGLGIAGACGSPKILVGGILHGPGRKPKCTLHCAVHSVHSVHSTQCTTCSTECGEVASAQENHTFQCKSRIWKQATETNVLCSMLHDIKSWAKGNLSLPETKLRTLTSKELWHSFDSLRLDLDLFCSFLL